MDNSLKGQMWKQKCEFDFLDGKRTLIKDAILSKLF